MIIFNIIPHRLYLVLVEFSLILPLLIFLIFVLKWYIFCYIRDLYKQLFCSIHILFYCCRDKGKLNLSFLLTAFLGWVYNCDLVYYLFALFYYFCCSPPFTIHSYAYRHLKFISCKITTMCIIPTNKPTFFVNKSNHNDTQYQCRYNPSRSNPFL